MKAVTADLGVTASANAELEARSLDTVQLGTLRRYVDALGYERRLVSSTRSLAGSRPTSQP
jgi:hypothetical protein